ncbi:MAG: DMT family transporter [Candidatus Zixiibacteriota bacterium]|nr:MAG: DMT family transporter [candidate division Zixibacteria bacterium]
MQIPYLGEIFAFATAIVWAFAVILYKKSGETIHPVALNFFKNLMGMVLLLPTIYFFEGWIFKGFTSDEIILLLVSGALGIGIADTLFFKCLNLLGAGLTAIVDCLYSPSIIFLAFLWVGERLGILQIIGVAMIISAVLTISRADKSGLINRRNLLLGILWGVLAMFTMAIGIVMIKPLLDRSPLLPLSEIRLFGGGLILALVFLFHPRRKQIATPRLTGRGWTYLLIGSFLGAYCVLLLWLAGMKYTQVSIAAALNQTSNIFIFIFAALFLKEAITRRKVVGIILGVSGALIVTFG